jgi:hypothetical protein
MGKGGERQRGRTGLSDFTANKKLRGMAKPSSQQWEFM